MNDGKNASKAYQKTSSSRLLNSRSYTSQLTVSEAKQQTPINKTDWAALGQT